jgi:hypothetical protein
MAEFKIVRDASNNVTASGPNDSNFEPAIPVGGSLTIENAMQPVFVPPAAQAKLDRRAAIEADVAGDTFAQAVDSATPNQIRAFIQNNVNSLADAKTFLAKLTMLVADTRRK